MVSHSIIVEIITIVYYFPALLLAVYTGLKHGFSRSAGWFNLNLLALFRLVGSSLGIAALYQQSSGVYVASIVFSSMGTASLVGALLGLIGRVDESLKERAFPSRFARYVQLATVAAIVLAIIGGNYAWSSDADKRSEGHTLSKAAIILILLVYVIAGGICLHSVVLRSLVPKSERRLMYVCVMSLPFILVRLVFAICATFLINNGTFSIMSTSTGALVIRAIMGLLMEFIVVSLFLWAGCTVDRSTEREAERAKKHSAQGLYRSGDGFVHESSFSASKGTNSEV